MYEILKATSVVVNNIDEKVKQLEEHLGAKGAKTYDGYCEMCGEIKGLLIARKFITDLTKNMEQLDE
jgi:uncharacterized protein YaaR (DUF327 family)